MDQEDAWDFKALRAKFQLDENLLKQPKPPTIKPAVPDKPKLDPLPTSSAAYLPAGARPSLLTSINHSVEGRTAGAPRVIFKEGKKEIKMPLIQVNTKGKDKSEVKLKKTKDKTTKGDDSEDQKPKKKLPLLPLLPLAPKERTAELVAAPAPPKVIAPKKKGFLGFRRTSKTFSAEVPADAILDTPSVDVPGPAPLIPTPVIPAPVIPAPLIPASLIPAPVIPAPSEFGDVPPAPQFAAPKALLPNIPTIIADSSAAQVEIPSPSTIPASPNFAPPPAFIPDIPTPTVTTPESETTPEIETPALHVSRPASPDDSIQGPPSAAPTPPPNRAISRRPPTLVVSALALSPPSPPSSPSPPSPPSPPEVVAPVAIEAEVETPPTPPATDPASGPPSPKAERSISALSALSRAEDMSPAKKCDQRIFDALAKARRKNSNPTSPRPLSMTTPSEDLPLSPTGSNLDFPPIDYQGNPPKPVNGLDHRQVSPVLDGITDAVPERLVLPPVPPKKALPVLPSLGLPPVKPERPRSVNLSGFIPLTPVEDNEIPSTPGFTETDVPEFDDVVTDVDSPGLQVSDWGNGDYEGPDSPYGQNLPELFGNGMTPPGADVHAEPVFGGQYQHNLLPETSLPVSEGSPQLPRLQADVANGDYESTDNLYEDVGASAGKKKGKTDVGKKRKGPPKNPYAAEAQPEVPNEEKVKTGRFGRIDKKAAAEGPDEKELKKREKQRLEKEKKELKERQEREKKEQKEREKRENEMKKKFKVTGQEDAMYQAQVTVTTKGRKNDLPVTSGDIVSIIRTTNCPKGKWLARDSSNNNYGYIAVDHVKLDIEEMLKLGKQAGITRQISKTNLPEEDTHTDGGPSNHYPNQGESFTDDSEEWTADDEEPFSPPPDTVDYSTTLPINHSRAFSMPDMGNKDISINHQHSRSDINSDGGSHVEARHEALQKLATFFHSPQRVEPAASSSEPETSPVLVEEEAAPLPEASVTQEADLDPTDMLILPPPDLYA